MIKVKVKKPYERIILRGTGTGIDFRWHIGSICHISCKDIPEPSIVQKMVNYIDGEGRKSILSKVNE